MCAHVCTRSDSSVCISVPAGAPSLPFPLCLHSELPSCAWTRRAIGLNLLPQSPLVAVPLLNTDCCLNYLTGFVVWPQMQFCHEGFLRPILQVPIFPSAPNPKNMWSVLYPGPCIGGGSKSLQSPGIHFQWCRRHLCVKTQPCPLTF